MEHERFDTTVTQEYQAGFAEDGSLHFDEAVTALTALARQKKLLKYSRAELFLKDELTTSVAAIMEAGAPAGTETDEDWLRSGRIAGDVAWYWEWCCLRMQQPSPFAELPVGRIRRADFKRADVRMVMDIGTTVHQILTEGFVVDKRADSQQRFATLIASQGPDYVLRWVRGDVIREHCERIGADPATWLDLVTVQERCAIALTTPSDPLQRYATILNHLTNTLSTANLARIMQVNESTIDELFSTSARKKIALKYRDPEARVVAIQKELTTELSDEQLAARYAVDPAHIGSVLPTRMRLMAMLKRPKDPLGFLDDFHHNLAILTVPNIAAELGWTVEQVQTLFTPGYLRSMAFMYPHTALSVVKRIAGNMAVVEADSLARHLGRTKEDIESVISGTARLYLMRQTDPISSARRVLTVADRLRQQFDLPPGVVRELAGTCTLKRALEIGERIVAEQAHLPRGVSRDVWASATFSYPEPGDQAKRLRQAQSYMVMLRISYARPLKTIPDRPTSTDVPDSTYDPAVIWDGDPTEDPTGELEELAARADITRSQLEALLQHFTGPDDVSLGSELAEALARMRAAARAA